MGVRIRKAAPGPAVCVSEACAERGAIVARIGMCMEGGVGWGTTFLLAESAAPHPVASESTDPPFIAEG